VGRQWVGRWGQWGMGVSGGGVKGLARGLVARKSRGLGGGRGVRTLVLGGPISKGVYSGRAPPGSGNTKSERRPYLKNS